MEYKSLMKLFRRRVRYCILMVLLVAGAPFAPDAAADSAVIERIRATKTLRVGMTGAQPPLNTVNTDGEIIGFEAELAHTLASAMAVKAEIVKTPFQELLPRLRSGKLDIVISGLTITPERNLEVSFVGPYFVSGKSILSRSETMSALQDAKEINKADVRLVALRGSTSQIFVEEILPKAKLETVADYAEARKMVLDGKVDALIADHPYCLFAVLGDETEQLVTLEEPFTFEPIGFAVPPNDPQFLNLVQNFLSMLEGTGALLDMKERYFTDGDWLDTVD